MDGRLKQISHLCLDMTNKNLLLGTEGGNIYTLNLTSFSIEDSIIYQDIVIQNSTDEFKVNPGAVEALQVHPTDVDKLLIGKSKRFSILNTVAQKLHPGLIWPNLLHIAFDLTPIENQ